MLKPMKNGGKYFVRVRNVGYNNDISLERASKAISLDVDQVKRVYADIENKRRSSKYLHLSPQLVKPVFTY